MPETIMYDTHQDAELQLTYKVANAPILTYPFPHFYIENVFPDAFYQKFMCALPDTQKMRPIKEVRGVQGYDERFVMQMDKENFDQLPESQRDFWTELNTWMLSGRFANVLAAKFNTYVQERLKTLGKMKFVNEILLVEDNTNYSLGPHTDSTKKLITVLFYLPKDESQKHLGTSIYLPKTPGFICEGGPHHPRENFNRLQTMPFLPNSMFVFLKTNNSFHGVERVQDENCKRWLLLFDINMRPLQ